MMWFYDKLCLRSRVCISMCTQDKIIQPICFNLTIFLSCSWKYTIQTIFKYSYEDLKIRRFYQIEKGWLESGPLATNFGRGVHWGGGPFADIEMTLVCIGGALGALVRPIHLGKPWKTLFTIRTNKHFILYLNLGP